MWMNVSAKLMFLDFAGVLFLKHIIFGEIWMILLYLAGAIFRFFFPPNNIIWAIELGVSSFCYIILLFIGSKEVGVNSFCILLLLKVNTKNIKIPTDKDFEWRWEATTMEIPFLIDGWEKGSDKVSPMCWMEWCSGTPSFLFYSVFFFFLLSIRFWTILLEHHTFLLLIIFPFSVPSFPHVYPILYYSHLWIFQPFPPTQEE